MTSVSEHYDPSYSLSSAIQLARTGKPNLSHADRVRQADIEKISNHRNGGLSILVPTNALTSVRQTRAMGTGTASGALSRIVQLPFGEALRQKSVLGRLGANIITVAKDPAGSVQLPRFEAGSSVHWVDEDGAGDESSPFLGGDLLTGKRAHVHVDLTRLLGSSSDALNQVSADIVEALATAIDSGVLAGGGPDFNQPLGILSREDIETIPLGTNGGPFPFSAILDAELAMNQRGFETTDLAWLLSPRAKNYAKKTPKIAGHPVYLLNDITEILNSSPVLSHTALPDDGIKGTGTGLSSAILGRWSAVTVVIFGAVEILVNPYTFSTVGLIRVSAYMSVDYGLKQPGAFVRFTDINTSGI